MDVEAKADKAIRLITLNAVASLVAEARRTMHAHVAHWGDDAWNTAEADEMETRVDDDIVGALMDIESTINQIRTAYYD